VKTAHGIPTRALACSLLLAACLSGQAPAPATSPPRPAIRVVKLSGTPFERGVTHGRVLKEEIHGLVARFKDNLRKQYGLEPEVFIRRFRLATEFEMAIAKWTPDLLDEVRGIAKGAGLDFDTMYVYQLVDEIWAQGRQVATVAARREAAKKCTSLGVDRRGDRPTLVAQNLDIPRWYHGHQTLLHITQPDNALQSYVLTVPGLLAANGVNSARIGVCVNTLPQLRPCKDGLPVAFVVRGLLAKKDWLDARAFLYEVRHASGQNYILGGPDVAHSYECSAGRVSRFAPSPGCKRVGHTNHPMANADWSERILARAKQRGRKPAEILAPCPRYPILTKLLRPGQEIGFDAVVRILSSKEDPRVPIDNPSTYACTIMLLATPPELHVCVGGPTGKQFEVYRFAAMKR